MSWLLIYRSVALEPSKMGHGVFAPTCMGGLRWFLLRCEFVWVSAA